jgi:hypothetical protein
MKSNKEMPEKLKVECKILYGILNMQEIKGEWLEEMTTHAAKIIAIHKNGLERKGKYKRLISKRLNKKKRRKSKRKETKRDS